MAAAASIAQVQSLITNFCASFTAKDAASMVTMLAPEATLVNHFGTAYKGRDAILNHFAPMFANGALAQPGSALTLDQPAEVSTIVDGAFLAYARWSRTAGGGVPAATGVFTTVFKQAGDSLVCVAISGVQDGKPGGPAAAAAAPAAQ